MPKGFISGGIVTKPMTTNIDPGETILNLSDSNALRGLVMKYGDKLPTLIKGRE